MKQSAMGKKIEIMMEGVFNRMLRKNPAMKDLFFKKCFLSWMEGDSQKKTMTIKSHAKFTVQVLDHVISHIDRKRDKRRSMPEMFDPKIIGGAHQCLEPLGFSGNYWEAFGEALTDEMFTKDAIRDMPGAPKAWVALAAVLVDLMRAGFESRRSALRRKSTFTYVHHHMNTNENSVNKRRLLHTHKRSVAISRDVNGDSSGDGSPLEPAPPGGLTIASVHPTVTFSDETGANQTPDEGRAEAGCSKYLASQSKKKEYPEPALPLPACM